MVARDNFGGIAFPVMNNKLFERCWNDIVSGGYLASTDMEISKYLLTIECEGRERWLIHPQNQSTIQQQKKKRIEPDQAPVRPPITCALGSTVRLAPWGQVT